MVPATQPIMGGDLQAVGVNITERVKVKLKPVMPQNFLIDPVATSIEEAMGVAIDEFVSLTPSRTCCRNRVSTRTFTWVLLLLTLT